MTVYNSIGATGRTFSTIALWEAATSISLSQIYVGEVWHDLAVGEPTETLLVGDDRLYINGATNINKDRYRLLRSQHNAGQQYDPITKTGVWIKRNIGTTSIKADAIRINEDRFYLQTMAIVSDYVTPPTTGASRAVDFYLTGSISIGICTRCYIEWGAHYCDGTAGTANGTALHIASGPTTGTFTIHNNIIVGGGARGNRGCNYGIRFQGSVDGRIIGNTVVDIVGWNKGSPAAVRGIAPGTGNTREKSFNNIVVWDVALTSANPYVSGIDSPFFTYASRGFITSDVSASSYGFGGDAFNKNNVVKGQLFVSAINHDYRLLSSAPAQDWDELQTHYTSHGVVSDFFGKTRSTVYADIGASDGAVTGIENAPTTVISTIGTGGTYADIITWEAATDINLIESNEVQIGEMLGDFSATQVVTMSGAITDAARYRELRPASTNHYSPVSDRGCTITRSVFSATVIHTIFIQEKFFRLTGPMKITAGLSYPGGDGYAAIVGVGIDADHTALEALFITMYSTTAGRVTGIIARQGQQNCTIKSCVIYGSDHLDNTSLQGGIRIRDYGQWKIYGCSIFGTTRILTGGTQVGIKIDSSTTCEIRNNIVIDCLRSGSFGSADYSIGSTPTTSCSNNISGDATAPGEDSLTSKTAANTWVNIGARNFYLKAGISEAREAGIERVNGAPIGTKLDALRHGRYRPYDIGALEGTKPYPQFPSPQIRNRVCHCYEIVRRDGVRLLLTDNNTPLLFMGDTWEAASMDASARRRELGMKAIDLEAKGGLTSDKITLLDLRAGRYQGARITEYIVDWRYPHLKPLAEARYTIESTTFNGETWKADVKGLPFILQNKVGDVFGRNCRYVLGDTECRAVLTGLAQIGKVVLDVIDKRQSWYVSASALSSVATDYYALGKLTWMTGNNNDIVTELFKNEVVIVNHLNDPNSIDGAYGGWTESGGITIGQVTNGFASSVHSWLFERDGTSWGGINSTLNIGTWADIAPKETKICLSVYVKRPTATPAEYCELKLSETTSSQIQHRGLFSWTGSAWEQFPDISQRDLDVTVQITNVVGNTDWWRLSIGYTTTGIEGASIQVKIRVGETVNTETNEDLEFSQAQFEVDVLTPTSWVVATKHKLQLAVRADADIVNGDIFNLDPGCDKLLATCKDKFSNIKNYGGFPYIPGVDKMFDTPIR